MDDLDLLYLHHALALAKARRGYCAPNPSVGAVIVQNGEIIARGFHRHAGAPHAEVHAFSKVKSRDLSQATIYVTLEPCCHQGRTPPCTDAIIRAGVKRVVYAYGDPNPIVAGKGEATLIAAGIICDHVYSSEIAAFYESYRHWHLTQRPYVTAKIALSLDGKIAGKDSERMQITGEALREFTHHRRLNSDAILTSIKTILHDDPMMNARLEGEVISKPLYILDSQLNLPVNANIMTSAKSITLLHAHTAPEEKLQALKQLGVRCVAIEADEKGLKLAEVVRIIGLDGIHDLWIEAGGACFASFAQANLLQRAYVYVAPLWVGVGKSAFPEDFQLEMSGAQVKWQQLGLDALCEIQW